MHTSSVSHLSDYEIDVNRFYQTSTPHRQLAARHNVSLRSGMFQPSTHHTHKMKLKEAGQSHSFSVCLAIFCPWSYHVKLPERRRKSNGILTKGVFAAKGLCTANAGNGIVASGTVRKHMSMIAKVSGVMTNGETQVSIHQYVPVHTSSLWCVCVPLVLIY